MEPTAQDDLNPGLSAAQIQMFRRRLVHWYRNQARELPWRDTRDPYRIWVSEVMLQQTRVNAVLEHYTRFLRTFPTIFALALAGEAEVLAAWSGLGYYRRARMLHKAAQFLVSKHEGVIPQASEELRKLPGVGEYTCAAIASIAFGESIAVVDGNVERVVLRVAGRAQDATVAGRSFVRREANALVPNKRLAMREETLTNAAGDHNQAMMELGATLCLPRAPLCLQCPVFDFCRTRGEHATLPRGMQKSHPAAYLLATRKQGVVTEVLLERRDAEASLMAGMLELPPLPMDAVTGLEPLLRLRHAITHTNYYVEIHAVSDERDRTLRQAVPAAAESLMWEDVSRLRGLPLTGLARKVLMRLDLISVAGPEMPRRG